MELSHLSPWLLLVAPAVIVVAYTVFGLSGFGSTMISVPVLAHFLPVSYLVPLMVLLDLACAAFLGVTGRGKVSKAELRNLVPFMLVGLALGATLLVGMPDRWLRLALGLFATAVGAYSLVNPTLTGTIARAWCIPTGIVGGAAATVFGAGGPLYATYLSGRLHDKGELRATISSLISLSAFTRAIVYAVTGLLLHFAILVGMVALAPFVWIGLRIGTRIHTGLTQAQLRRALGAIIAAMGVSLIVRVVMQS
jgi:uncharacterized membrane protein YfcA